MISYNSGEIGIGDHIMMIRCSWERIGFGAQLVISCNLKGICIGDHIMIRCSWEGIGFGAPNLSSAAIREGLVLLIADAVGRGLDSLPHYDQLLFGEQYHRDHTCFHWREHVRELVSVSFHLRINQISRIGWKCKLWLCVQNINICTYQTVHGFEFRIIYLPARCRPPVVAGNLGHTRQKSSSCSGIPPLLLQT